MEGIRKILNQYVSLTKTLYKLAVLCQGGRSKEGGPERRNLRSTCHGTAFFLRETLLVAAYRKDVWGLLFACLLACIFSSFLMFLNILL